jgi:hypothetical protein
MTTSRFVDLWSEGDNSFALDPPNAVLSFAEPTDRAPEEVVVTISERRLNGDSLTYRVTVLDGTLPTSTGPCALFIDPFGRPLSPVSAAGMHRRERRRMRRLRSGWPHRLHIPIRSISSCTEWPLRDHEIDAVSDQPAADDQAPDDDHLIGSLVDPDAQPCQQRQALVGP